MDQFARGIIWRQFGAAIDMIENAVHACPDELWKDRSAQPEFWYSVFHVLFFLDLFATGKLEGFAPPSPFTLDELDPVGIIPEKPYTKEELLDYLRHDRAKCLAAVESLDDERARALCTFSWVELPYAELQLYAMRHVQHHAGQLNLILKRETGAAPRWVRQAKTIG